jgi:uncharacterized membrane protein
MSNFCSQCGKPVLQNADFCTNCGSSLAGKKPVRSEWEGKRERVLGNGQTRKRHRTKTAIMIAGIAIAAAWVYTNLPGSGNAIVKAQPVVLAPAKYSVAGQQMFDTPSRLENGKIILPLDLVKEKKFVAFHYQMSNNIVPLLAYVSGEGKIVTAISMCEPCNSQRFHIKGDELICNSCGSKWKVDNLEAISGSCSKYPPDAVPNSLVGNEIQIDEQLAATWQRRI